MRCLYCGKELAFLKRLTGGGEFCSDAHRQKYQEEYNQLALSRLLQAQNVPEEEPPKSARKAANKATPAPVPEPVATTVAAPPEPPAPIPGEAPSEAPVDPIAEPVAEAAAAPPADALEPQAPSEQPPAAQEPAPLAEEPPPAAEEPPPAPEEPPPAPIAGFLTEAVRPAQVAAVAPPPAEDAVPTEPGSPELPHRDPVVAVSVSPADLPLAHPVRWEPDLSPAPMAVQPHRPAFDLRDFVRGAETPSLHLTASSTVTPPAAEPETLETPRAGLLPPPPAQLWTAPAPAFTPLAIARGELARLDETHTAFDQLKGLEEPAPEAPVTAPQLPLAGPAPAASKSSPPPPVHIHPTRSEPVLIASRNVLATEPPLRRPVQSVPPAPRPVVVNGPPMQPMGQPPPAPHNQPSQSAPQQAARHPQTYPSQPAPPRPAQVRNFPIPMGVVFVPQGSPYTQGSPAAEPHAHAQPPMAHPAAEPPAHTPPPASEAAPQAPPQAPQSPQEWSQPPAGPHHNQGMRIQRIMVGDDGALTSTGPLPSAPEAEPQSWQAPTGVERQAPETNWQAPPQQSWQAPPETPTPDAQEPAYWQAPPQQPQSWQAPPQAPAPDAAPHTQEPAHWQAPPQQSWQPSQPDTSVDAAQPPALPSEPVATEPAARPHAIPERVTRSLPVTLHGMSGNPPRAIQVFTKLLATGLNPSLPPTNALPLRPLLVLGPAPADAAAQPEPKPSQKAPQAASAQPEPVQHDAGQQDAGQQDKDARKESARPGKSGRGKSRRADVRILTPAPSPEPEPEEQKSAAAAEPPRVHELPKPLAAPTTDLDLGLPTLHLETSESRWARLPRIVKIGVAAAIVAAITGLAYLVLNSGRASAGDATAAVLSTGYEVGLPIADNGWIENWAGSGSRVPKITILRGSIPLSDYRMEFSAQIESKAIGWVYRALNPRTYYVVKLETIKPGLEPTVALVRYAVIDGSRETRVEHPLPFPVRVDTNYNIRFEAVGSRFTVWVQDQKIDEWSDKRIGSGGVGLYSEPGEIAALQSVVNVVPLVPKN